MTIEVDGIHHRDARGRQRRQDLARDIVLHDLGWRVIPVPACRCLAAPDHTAASIIRNLAAPDHTAASIIRNLAAHT